MKAKIMALIVALGLGVTGVAITAQAAEAKVECSHSTGVIITKFVNADYVNPQVHHSTYKIIVKCGDCGVLVDESTIYKDEAHDYEQIFLSNGKVLLYCSACDDSYFQ